MCSTSPRLAIGVHRSIAVRRVSEFNELRVADFKTVHTKDLMLAGSAWRDEQ